MGLGPGRGARAQERATDVSVHGRGSRAGGGVNHRGAEGGRALADKMDGPSPLTPCKQAVSVVNNQHTPG